MNCRGLETLGEGFELRGRRGGTLEIPGGDRGFDMSREQPRTPEARRHPAREREPERGGRGLGLPAAELEKRTPGLGLVPELVCPSERDLRARQVTPPSQHLACRVECHARTVRLVRHQLVARQARFRLGLDPVAAQRRDRDAMDPAEPSERGLSAGQILAPAERCIRPLAGAAQVGQLPARNEHVTVDPAGEERAQLSRDHRAHRFVEVRDTLGDATPCDPRTPPALGPKGDQVGAAQPLAERDHTLVGRQRVVALAGPERVLPLREPEEPVLDALGLGHEMTLGPPQPAARDSLLASEDVIPEKEPRRVGCSAPLTRSGKADICLLARRNRFVDARRPPCCVGESLELIGSELGELAFMQLFVNVRPRRVPCHASS